MNELKKKKDLSNLYLGTTTYKDYSNQRTGEIKPEDFTDYYTNKVNTLKKGVNIKQPEL